MKRRELLFTLIPSYPGGCSKELLALSAGYVKKPYSLDTLERGTKKLERDLAWLTVEEPSIVERKLPMQRTTLAALKNLGCPVIESESAIYISRDYREEEA